MKKEREENRYFQTAMIFATLAGFILVTAGIFQNATKPSTEYMIKMSNNITYYMNNPAALENVTALPEVVELGSFTSGFLILGFVCMVLSLIFTGLGWKYI